MLYNVFIDRFDAAHQLAQKLSEYKDRDDVVILAIPRGGLQLGAVLAKELNAPLDVVFSKKVGAPGDPELAIGAVGIDYAVIDPEYAEIPALQNYFNQEVNKIRARLQERANLYHGTKPPVDLKDKIVIVTDDGVATGHTLMLTLSMLRKYHPRKIIVAVPVGPREAIDQLKKYADEVVSLYTPETFWGIGQFYRNFEQVEDPEAIALLHKGQP